MKETRYIFKESSVTDSIEDAGRQLDMLSRKVQVQATLEGSTSQTMAALLQSLPDEGRIVFSYHTILFCLYIENDDMMDENTIILLIHFLAPEAKEKIFHKLIVTLFMYTYQLQYTLTYFVIFHR